MNNDEARVDITYIPDDGHYEDSIVCPNCGGEAVRDVTDDFKDDSMKHYICHNCNSDSFVHPEDE